MTNFIMTMDLMKLALLGASCCVMLTGHFTTQLLTQHFFYWKNPKEQKAIVIIILLAPLYSITSYVGLLDIKGSEIFFTFLDSIKKCYEALVIAKFMALMYSYLNISLTHDIIPKEMRGRVIRNSFPISLFMPPTIRLEQGTLKLLKYWIWQFVVIRPVCSILMPALHFVGVYPDWLSWTFTIVLYISVSMALYAVVLFYHVFAKELAPHKPLSKFVCIEGIVFFCFWQDVVLNVLTSAGIIKSHWLNVDRIEITLKNTLVLLEMIVFSVIQQYAFHVAPYSGEEKRKRALERKTD